MKNLINITTSSENPTFADATSITAIQIQPKGGVMSIYTEKGLLFGLEMKRWNVDADDLLQKLAAAGNPLTALPMRHNGQEYPHFIAPAAVTFATITTANEDGTQGIIAGVRGLGWEENYEAKPEEVTTFLDAVRASGTQLMAFAPSEAYARWSNAAALYIDPASVTEMRDDGGQLNVAFAASGTLDIQTERYSASAPRRTRDEEHIARADLAAKIADANGTLTKIPGASRAVYIQPEEFTAIRFHTADDSAANKYSMMLERPKAADNPYREAVRVSFNTASAREAAFNAVLSAAQTPTAKKAKPPQP